MLLFRMQDIQSLVLELIIFSFPFPRKINVWRIIQALLKLSRQHLKGNTSKQLQRAKDTTFKLKLHYCTKIALSQLLCLVETCMTFSWLITLSSLHTQRTVWQILFRLNIRVPIPQACFLTVPKGNYNCLSLIVTVK